ALPAGNGGGRVRTGLRSNGTGIILVFRYPFNHVSACALHSSLLTLFDLTEEYKKASRSQS
ncbi:hypothetical protein, partial [Klebsiella oxytoca]|uniref:hypothetical protein n=1 Tax=Klebsiella oxytoca TaxID=571 RepID=UPI001CCB60F8